MVLGAAFLGAIGQILFKKGAEQFTLSLQILKNFYFIGGGLLYVVALIITMFAYKKAQVSVLYPIIAFSYIFTIVFAGIFLKEPITWQKIAGSLIIILGVALTNT